MSMQKLAVYHVDCHTLVLSRCLSCISSNFCVHPVIHASCAGPGVGVDIPTGAAFPMTPAAAVAPPSGDLLAGTAAGGAGIGGAGGAGIGGVGGAAAAPAGWSEGGGNQGLTCALIVDGADEEVVPIPVKVEIVPALPTTDPEVCVPAVVMP